ncbi:hydrophobic protein [Egicoccus sp. AB-alg2]|uniref:hydrophobic protein n=1 Tax=Egicoccus sp. AB-alg2 TaxID=3242693 RepID=UPI00359EA1A5
MGGLAILLLILALIVGGIGLFVEALWWLLIIAVVLAVVGFISGRGRGSRV